MSAGRNVYAVVPIKDPAQGKARLSSVLSGEERSELCVFFARRTLETCAAAFGAERTLVVTASAEIRLFAAELGVQVVAEDEGTGGLNAAIVLGAARANREGAEALLVVPADLPLASVDDLRAAARAVPDAPGCLLVPDRRNSGTNLLGLAPPREDLFAFGEHSLERHAELAARAGCNVRIYTSAALALDVDLPEDFTEWRRRQEFAYAPGASRALEKDP